MFDDNILLIFKDLKKSITHFSTLLSVSVAHEKQQRLPHFDPNLPLVGIDPVRVWQDHVFNKRRLIGLEPPEVRNQEHRIPHPIDHSVKRIGILAHYDVIPPPIALPILLLLQPLHQLLLHPLVAVLPGSARGVPERADRVDDEAEGGEEGDVEEIRVIGIEGAPEGGGGGPNVGGEVGEEPPLGGVLVAGVAKIGVGEGIGGVAGAEVAADDAVGELGGEVIEVDLGDRRAGESGGGGGEGRGGGEEGVGEDVEEEEEDEEGGEGGL